MRSLRRRKQRTVGGGQQIGPERALSQRATSDLKPVLGSQVHGSPGKVPSAPDLSLVLVTMGHTYPQSLEDWEGFQVVP